MRNLHARDDHGGGRARQEADARADAHRAGGQLVSLHGLRGDLSVDSQRLGCTAKIVHHEDTTPTRDTKIRKPRNKMIVFVFFLYFVFFVVCSWIARLQLPAKA